MTQDEILEMLMRLQSEEYTSGQDMNPADAAPESLNIDPFAQFQAANQGLLKPKFQPRRGPVQGPMPEPQRPMPKMTNAFELSNTQPSFLDAATNVRSSKDQAFNNLTQSLEKQALPLKLLSMFAPLVGAAAPYLRNASRPSQPPMAGPVAMPRPTPTPGKPSIPSMIGAPEFPTPVIRKPSSELKPKGDADKFSSKGGKKYLDRQERDPANKPDWVNRGAKELDYKAKTKKKENPFAPKPVPGEKSPLEKLVEAGKTAVARGREPKVKPFELMGTKSAAARKADRVPVTFSNKRQSPLSLQNILSDKPVVMTPEEELEMIRRSRRGR